MNAAELISVLGPRLSNTKLIVVANREPHTIYDWAASVIRAAWRMSEAAA